ncbi:Integrase (fragment) [Cupriavidus taiwanensis]|uniref:Integrase n=1 Tax=Cupriavidus taiwanensis TaxID=164546 RepID=A0A375HEA0_9BURK
MNTHKNARLTFGRRLEVVQDITEHGLSVRETFASHGVTALTARKWCWAAIWQVACRRSPRTIDPSKALLIFEWQMLQRQIARSVGVSESTVSRLLARAGLSRLADLPPREPVMCYEHAASGTCRTSTPRSSVALERPRHRVTGNRRDSVGSNTITGTDHIAASVAVRPCPDFQRRERTS